VWLLKFLKTLTLCCGCFLLTTDFILLALYAIIVDYPDLSGFSLLIAIEIDMLLGLEKEMNELFGCTSPPVVPKNK
jgi:membrane-associated PAP2 superfamily phosphatase